MSIRPNIKQPKWAERILVIEYGSKSNPKAISVTIAGLCIILFGVFAGSAVNWLSPLQALSKLLKITHH